ncbi:MAG: Calvin cycle protein CP12 [Synechococcus sp.]|nr:Calvin cycle protein CP12 [Synechococcus sp.]
MTDSISIDKKIELARQEARNICAEKGETSPECAAAWDVLEELQAEAAHQRSNKVEKTPMQLYCEANPGDLECKIFDD